MYFRQNKIFFDIKKQRTIGIANGYAYSSIIQTLLIPVIYNSISWHCLNFNICVLYFLWDTSSCVNITILL